MRAQDLGGRGGGVDAGCRMLSGLQAYTCYRCVRARPREGPLGYVRPRSFVDARFARKRGLRPRFLKIRGELISPGETLVNNGSFVE